MAESTPPISEEEINLLKACQSEDEWNATCSIIKARRGGAYPPDWWPKIMQSGLADRITAKWGGDTKIRIVGVR